MDGKDVTSGMAKITGFDENGSPIFTDTPKKGTAQPGKPDSTTKDLLISKLVKTRKSLIPEGVNIPPEVRTKVDLSEWLVGMGFDRRSEEYWSVYKLISPEFEAAINVGESLADIEGNTDPGTPALPARITTKLQLADWLTRDLKVKRGSEPYNRLYSLYREALTDGY